MRDLKQYKSFQELSNELVYMNKVKDIFSVSLGSSKILIYMFFKEDRKYCYEFIIKDDNILKKLKNTAFIIKKERISNKAAFLNKLKKNIDIIIPILQQNNYKLSFTPEINLFDLENIEDEFGINNDNIIKEDNAERSLVNKVILFHNILSQNLVRSPFKRNWRYIVEINSLSMSNAVLFPEEDKYFENIDFLAEAAPNLYFPNIITLKVKKDLDYKNIPFSIIFSSQSTIQNYAKIAQEYYIYYKDTKKEQALSFSTKLLSVIKNPYNTENMGEINPEEVIKLSQCSKCNSTSSMFSAIIGTVDIETKMSSLQSYSLYPENILEYKDVLQVKCAECGNILFEDKAILQKIKDKREKIKSENWINPETNIPLLDSPEERAVVVKYDLIELDLEFDTTNPSQPKAILSTIQDVWKITGWLDKQTKTYTSFY